MAADVLVAARGGRFLQPVARGEMEAPADYTGPHTVRPTPPPPGAIAQLGERLDRTQEVAGSSPASSTHAQNPR
jgi:hypothetical protein